MDPQDMEVLKTSSELIKPLHDEIIEEFYDYISSHEELLNFLKKQNVLPSNLHETFRKYLDSLLSGTYDSSYIATRRKIGETHYKIGLPLSWYQQTQEILKWILIRHFKKNLEAKNKKQIYFGLAVEAFQNALAKIMTVDLLTITDAYFTLYTSELQNAKQEAENASKAKNMILAAVSHDLRSPLFALTAFSDLLLEAKELTSESQTYVKAIHRNSNMLLQLVNNLLELIKSEHDQDGFKIENINLPALLSELIEDTKALVKDRPILVEKIDNSLNEFSILQSNRQYLHRILQNLLSNSAKFTKSGKIELECYFELHRRQYHFLVKDTGRGIRSSDHESVFKEFFQAKRNEDPPGAGLGLALSKNLAKRLGGDLVLKYSAPEEGSCFELILPCH